MTMRMKPFAVLIAVILGAAACEDGVTEAPAVDEEAVLEDAALMAADAMFQDLTIMQPPATWASFANGPSAAPGIEINGTRSFSKTVTFFDADGNEQAGYDEKTTASMRVESELERDAAHTFWTASIERKRDVLVTGLEGAETQRTWNGTTESEVYRSRHPDGGTERIYDMESSGLIEDVVRGVPRKDNPYPLSGTIRRNITAEITKDGTTETKVMETIITFDGDNIVTMTVNGEPFEIDLNDRGVKKRFKNKKKNG